ncbi:AfsR/SARP family transcriptional regulator [Streptomyces daliensis]|uniref:AfsR/SARP family transcriptional regulator n=1 Tax=Streptomyces daliensis TaxID=299421 RepID=A0A8T4IN08_9ACTN|nr:AfsR/SARP family transcriptional regulator [Streptomyces daliensis]
MEITVRLLGALDVTSGGRHLKIPTGKLSIALTSLALYHGRTLPVLDLAEYLWGTELPTAPRATIRSYIKRLRQILDPAQGSGRDGTSLIEGGRGGYALSGTRVAVDATEFRARLGHASELRAAGDTHGESRTLDSALELWRGPLLANVDAPELMMGAVPLLEEERRRALHRRVALSLDGLCGGDPGAYVPRLRQALACDPLQEHFWEQLILALQRCGRSAEALREYERCRRLLSEELGIAPAAGLRQLHQTLLADGADQHAAERGDGDVSPWPTGTGERAALLRSLLAGRRKHVSPHELPAGFQRMLTGHPRATAAGPGPLAPAAPPSKGRREARYTSRRVRTRRYRTSRSADRGPGRA